MVKKIMDAKGSSIQMPFEEKTAGPFVYSGDLNTNHLNTGNIWIPNFLTFGFQMVWYSNGWFMYYVQCTRLTIQIPNQYIRKQDGVHLSDFQMVWLSGIQMGFEYQAIWHWAQDKN